MIVQFSVSNFASIRSPQTLSFLPTPDSYMSEHFCHQVKPDVKLLKIGIIYGANASGKSNVLKALDFLRTLMLHIPADRNDTLPLTPFMLDDESRKEKTAMDLSFYVGETLYKLSVSFDKTVIYSEKLVYYPSVQPAVLYDRKYDPTKDATTIMFGKRLELGKSAQATILGNTLINSSVIAAFAKSNVETSRLNEVYAFLKDSLKSVVSPKMSFEASARQMLLQDEGFRRFAVKFMAASDFNVEGIGVVKDETGAPIISFNHKTDHGSYQLLEELESAGTIRYLGLSVLLYDLLSQNRIIAIDEIENSIHHELLSYLIRVFLANSENQSQLVMTTHDINLLNEDYLRRDIIWFTDKNEQGETHLIRLSDLGLHKHVSAYNAYRQNKLVKLPFVGQTFINLKED